MLGPRRSLPPLLLAAVLLAPHSGCSVASSRPKSAESPPSAGKTLRTSGAHILDTCGQPWRARGVEQLAASAFAADGTLVGLAAELGRTGSNAVRLLPQVDEVRLADLDALLRALTAERIVVYLSPGDRSWFARPEVRAVLHRHQAGLIVDAFQEPAYADVPRWVREAKQAVTALRAAGYTCPLTVMADSHGRNLAAVAAHGQEIVDSDPERNVILGWQAYWGEAGTYRPADGMTLREGLQRAAELAFPVQLGIDLYADPDDRMDYQEVMSIAEREGMGWLWWNFWNRWDSLGNNMSEDGTAQNLTPVGRDVIEGHRDAIKHTAHKACFR